MMMHRPMYNRSVVIS